MNDPGLPTINGTPLSVIGTKIRVGEKARDVELHDGPLSTFKVLEDTRGKVRIVSVVLCIDTGVCEAQTRWLNQQVVDLGATVEGITISTDLPETLFRWAGMNGVENVNLLSDHFGMRFGYEYGTWLRELRKDQRAILVIDKNDVVQYVEYVAETGHHINYQAAEEAARCVVEQGSDTPK
jgi:thioredoxin-dependent peroxiredoxin